MRGGRANRALGRLTVLLTTLGLLFGLSHGAWAAPAGQADAIVDEIQQQVAQIRGLSARAPTPIVTTPRADLVERLSRGLNNDKAVREFLTSQMLLEVLGAMEPGFDLRDLQLRMLAEQTIAVYDFDARSIYLVADQISGGDPGADGRLVLAHELTHALQDQHFDLKRVLPADAENSDAATAALALVEGDAMLTMRIWGRQFLRPNEKRALGDDAIVKDPVLDSAPLVVRGELLFPYEAGWVFAQLLHQDGGYAAIDRAFARPPRSTEQILHPEKYAGGEAPVAVKIPPLALGLGGTWQTLRTDVFGELVLRLLLEQHVGWPTAEAAAAGWGGDAYTILEDADGRRVVATVTVWDTESDAAQMYNAFVQSIAAQHQGRQRRTLTQPSVARWTVPDYQVQALKTDKVVRIIYAPDAQTLDRVELQLSETSIGPAGPIVPLPTMLPEPAPPEGPPPPPRVPPAPDGEPDRFPPPVTPEPRLTPMPNVSPEEEEQDAPTPPGERRPAPPAFQPPDDDPPPGGSRQGEDVQTAPTPPTIQPLPRVTPVPLPSDEEPSDD
jgi:hypothetical protein